MQRQIFRSGEGDQYFYRNAEANQKNYESALADPSTDAITTALLKLKPKSLLEIGTGNGWRLALARKFIGARCIGTDPSSIAIADGIKRFPEITLSVGTADDLGSTQVDAVVFAFCLYLCDRSDLFTIAAEADRVLNRGGHILVYDFCTTHAYSNEYRHKPGVMSYKMDYSRLWSWHPSYVLWSHEVLPFLNEDPDNEDNRLALSILKKL
jgi:ubiquinone/menaquinone biosynthesis C-methylase UbiE